VSSLCLCLTSSSFNGAIAQLERYGEYIDMAEMRLDLLNPDERHKALKLPQITGIPLILTIRLPQDGGKWGEFGESEEERILLFKKMLESGGWTFVDLEDNRLMADTQAAALSSGVRIIRSVHDFQGSLLNLPVAEISGQIRRIADKGYIPKIATRCTGSRQLLTLARTAVSTESVKDKVLLGMDEYGIPSRILAHRFGSLWTYSSAAGGPGEPVSAASGQLDPETLTNLYRFRDIDDSTALYGVTGNPIAHSLSPELHNRWLQDSGLNGTYIPIRSDDMAALVETCDIWGLKGLSVTVPHKKKALSLCDYADISARSIGAANTLLRGGDGWRARNTDAEGFLKTLPAAMNLRSIEELNGKKALIIGAGGAARAAVYALTKAGMKLVILNRTIEKARHLAEETKQQWGALSPESFSLLEGGVDLAVQTTNVGMFPDSSSDPIPWWNPSGCLLVYDMIYQPEETVLLARSRGVGINTKNGSGMLEAQARIQFELFTGRKAGT